MDLAIYQLTRLVNSVNRKGGTKIERNRDLYCPHINSELIEQTRRVDTGQTICKGI